VRARGPLAGRRIIVTRSRRQAGILSTLLEAEGAVVVEFPTIRIAPPADYAAVDRAIARLDQYRWVVFTSQNGVAAFLGRLRACGLGPAALGRLRVAAIGPATAGALQAQGLRVDLAPAEFVAEALVDAFAGERLEGARILLPRALEARRVLPDGLRARGATVDAVPVYRVEAERGQDPETWRQLLDRGGDAVTFTSPSTVRNFVEVVGSHLPKVVAGALIACIGPVTAATARECGLGVGVVARSYTIPGIVAALREALGRTMSPAGS